MDKIDYRKEYKELYAPPAGRVVEVTVPKFQFAMVDQLVAKILDYARKEAT